MLTDEQMAEETRRAVYSALFKFARSQGMTDVEALVYAARWDGVVIVAKSA